LNDLGAGGLVYLGLWFIATACIFVWLWAMGSFLNSIQKLGVRMNEVKQQTWVEGRPN
jgi:hypothetical protein